MSKIKIISDKNLNSMRIKKSLSKITQNSKLRKSDISIVIGGDGFMLQTLKKNKNSKKIFYGINSGNYGFLMNKFSSKIHSYLNLFHKTIFYNFYTFLELKA